MQLLNIANKSLCPHFSIIIKHPNAVVLHQYWNTTKTALKCCYEQYKPNQGHSQCLAVIPNLLYFTEVTDSAAGVLSPAFENNPINTRQVGQKADLYSTVFVFLIRPGVTMVTEECTAERDWGIWALAQLSFLLKFQEPYICPTEEVERELLEWTHLWGSPD